MSKVYLIQDIPGTSKGEPKYNIVGAQKYGEIVSLLPEFSQMIHSPGPLVMKLRTLLKNYTEDDYLLLSGDPAIIGVVCSLVSDTTNGKYKLVKMGSSRKNLLPYRSKYFSKNKLTLNLLSLYFELQKGIIIND